jgi:hypothetical protein
MLDSRHESEAEVKTEINFAAMSSLSKTPFYGEEPRLRRPSCLRSKNCDVLTMAREPYGSNVGAVDMALANDLIPKIVSRITSESSLPKHPQLLTVEQVVKGDFALNLKSLNWNGSSGFLHRHHLKGKIDFKGKKFLLKEEGVVSEQGMAYLTDLIEEGEKLLDEGICVNINIDNLKDELLFHEKVDAGKTRLYFTSELMFLTLLRRYTGGFASWIYQNRVKNGIAIGVNPYSDEWDSIYYHLYNHSPHAIFGDYGKFDKRQLIPCMMLLVSLMTAFYGDAGTLNEQRRYVLVMQLFKSLHVTVHNGKIYFYLWRHGNTSGNFLTAILNSLVGIFNVHYIGATMLLENDGVKIGTLTHYKYDFDRIRYGLKYIILGDDIVLTVKKELMPMFNFNSMKEHIEKHLGMEFNDELKGKTGEAIPDYRDITEGSFLGMKFRPIYYKGKPKICACLREYSIVENLQWKKTKALDPAEEVRKFSMHNVKWSHYPREIFYANVTWKAKRCYELYGEYPLYTDYDTAFAASSKICLADYYYDTFVGENISDDVLTELESC